RAPGPVGQCAASAGVRPRQRSVARLRVRRVHLVPDGRQRQPPRHSGRDRVMPTSVFQGLAQDLTVQKLLNVLGAPPTYEVDAVSTGAATAGTVSGTFVWD